MPTTPTCRVCGQKLLLVRPGRDLCARCRSATDQAFDDQPGAVRTNDHLGSQLGADKVFGRTGNQRRKLFAAWLELGEANDYEAAVACGLAEKRGCCWWKRSGELRDAGVLTFTGRLRPGLAEPSETSVVTDLGRKLWERL